MKYSKWIFIVAMGMLAGGVFTSCSEDALSDKSIFDTDPPQRNELDNWLLTEYVEPYNINFKYRLDDKETNQQYNLVPADYDKSIALAKLVKFLWLESYEELMNDNGKFIKTYCPKVITPIGSKAYNPDSQSVVLGTAEGGLKVILYNVNELDVDNPDVEVLNEWYFKTMHHEFSHILHQTINYPVEYNEISMGKYTGPSWVNLKEQEALLLGFISPYASTETQEDFVEMIANYVTHDAAWWRDRMNMAGDAKDALQQKLDIVKDYLADAWDIDLDKLRSIVQRRSSEVSSLDLSSLK